MIIALFLNDEKPTSLLVATNIKNFFINHKIKLVADEGLLDLPPIKSVDPKKIDFIICLGGDGTILKASHKYAHVEAAILGINLGSLGFMADIPIPEIENALEELVKGNYKIEKRIMLEGTNHEEKSLFAANDFVIHRGSTYSLIELGLFVNDFYVNTFVADGLIVSTPNGSTAYSLAANGPILTPDLEALVITPICPHTISNRPIVLSSSSKIKITNLSDVDAEIHADGALRFNFSNNNSFFIKKSIHTFNLVKFSKYDFFSTLRSKLNWIGKTKIN